MIAKWLAVAATMALGAFGTLCPAYGQSLYFLYSNGVYSTLTVPDSIFTQAFAINNSGQYVGDTVLHPMETYIDMAIFMAKVCIQL